MSCTQFCLPDSLLSSASLGKKTKQKTKQKKATTTTTLYKVHCSFNVEGFFDIPLPFFRQGKRMDTFV